MSKAEISEVRSLITSLGEKSTISASFAGEYIQIKHIRLRFSKPEKLKIYWFDPVGCTPETPNWAAVKEKTIHFGKIENEIQFLTDFIYNKLIENTDERFKFHLGRIFELISRKPSVWLIEEEEDSYGHRSEWFD